MKTTPLMNHRNISFSKITFTHFLIAFISFLSVTGSSAQSNYLKHEQSFGMSAGSTISANRFGIMYSPGVFFKTGKNTFGGGLLVQKANFHATGAQFNYQYSILDENSAGSYVKWLELYAFAYAGYYNDATLNNTVCTEERLTNPELRTDLAQVKLKALDAYAGFGCKISILRNFKWFTSVGIGGYNVLNAPKGLYYNSRAMGLSMTTGLSYQFNKYRKTNF